MLTNLIDCFLSHVMEVFSIISSNIFSGRSFLSFFSFWDSYNSNAGAFNSFIFKVISDMYDPITIFLIKQLRKFGFIFCGSFPSVVFPA